VVRSRLGLLCALVLALAGCAPPVPQVVAPAPSAPPRTVPSTDAASAAAVPALPPPVLPSVPAVTTSSSAGFPEGSAASCAGRPGADQVVALVRAKGILDGTGTVSARLGPLCAGTWQYTILAVPGREPLQVVSQGQPGALVLVTAGTDVCTDQVRAAAPAGIVAAAHCG
jgi:hypothetical protein